MNPKFKRWVALAVCMCLTSIISSAGLSINARADEIQTVQVPVKYGQTEARAMLEPINSFRTGQDAWYWNQDGTQNTISNLEALSYDYQLEKDAMKRVAEVIIDFNKNHTRPNGSEASTIYKGEGTSYGEVMAKGKDLDTAQKALEAWKETEEKYEGQSHRRVLLDERSKAVGVGHAVFNGVHYWVASFTSVVSPDEETKPDDADASVDVEVLPDTPQKRAAIVEAHIASIGTVDLSKKDIVLLARAEYDNLTAAEAAFVDSSIFKLLKNAEKKLSELESGDSKEPTPELAVTSQQEESAKEQASDSTSRPADDSKSDSADSSQMGDTSKPVSQDSSQGEGDAKQAGQDSSQTKEDAKPAGQDSSQAKEDTKQADQDSSQAKEDAKQTGQDSSQAKEDAKQASQDSSQAKEDAKQAGQDSSQTKEDAKQTGQDSSQPKEDTKPTGQDSPQVNDTSKPDSASSSQTGDASKPDNASSEKTSDTTSSNANVATPATTPANDSAAGDTSVADAVSKDQLADGGVNINGKDVSASGGGTTSVNIGNGTGTVTTSGGGTQDISATLDKNTNTNTNTNSNMTSSSTSNSVTQQGGSTGVTTNTNQSVNTNTSPNPQVNTSSNTNNINTSNGNMATNNTTNTGNTAKFTVTYEPNMPANVQAGTVVYNMPLDKNTYNAGSVVTVGVSPNSNIMFFAGWNTKPDGTGDSYAKGSKITMNSNLVLYAQWIPSCSDNNGFTYQVTGNKTVVLANCGTRATGVVTIPDTFTFQDVKYKVRAIGRRAFFNNKSITKLVTGSNLRRIRQSAFFGCSNLTSVSLGTGLMTIRKHAFCHVNNNCTITIGSMDFNEIGAKPFNHGVSNMVIYVPAIKLDAYSNLVHTKMPKLEVKPY